MVFPLFATFYYWAPMVSSRRLSARLGRWAFWLMFAGFNVAFFPMHLTGLLGMPRRVWTYPGDMGWNTLNMVSTVGAYVLAAGVLVFLIDLVLNFRPGGRGSENPWGAGTLEWLPNDVYSTRSIPLVTSREPLWDRPSLPDEVRGGHHFLPDAPTGGRETIVTSAVEGRPEYVIQMPGNGWPPFIAAVFTAAFFLLLTVKIVTPALACGVVAIAAVLVWAWGLDPGPGKGRVAIGAGIELPTYMAGPASHSWWAMGVLVAVAASLYLAYVFSYLFLWVVSPEVWAPHGSPALPGLAWPLATGALVVAGSAAMLLGRRILPEPGGRSALLPWAQAIAAACLAAAIVLEIAGHWRSGLRPSDNAYGAMVYMGGVLNAQLAFALLIMIGFAAARHLTGRLDRERRVSYENGAILYYYAAGQILAGLVLVHGFPRAMA
jgi:cytochrome c oxidase subunit I+III